MSANFALLTYTKAEDYSVRQQPFAEAHREHVMNAGGNGGLLLAGSLFDPDDGAAQLVFSSEVAARRFAEGDPYVVHGIVRSWTIRRWEVVIGADRLD